jgi:hypothetical protein
MSVEGPESRRWAVSRLEDSGGCAAVPVEFEVGQHNAETWGLTASSVRGRVTLRSLYNIAWMVAESRPRVR